MPNDKKQLKEGIPSMLKKFTDNFFDGLKYGAINKALKDAEKNKRMPPPIVQDLRDMQKKRDELIKKIQKYDPSYQAPEMDEL